MAWWVAPLVIGAGKIGATALMKPRKYKADTKWIDELAAKQREEMRNRRVEQTINISGQRAIASQTERARQITEYGAVRSGVGGTGITEAANLEITKGAQKAAGDVATQATLTQEQINEQRRGRIEELEVIRQQALAEAKDRHRIETKNWEQQMLGQVIEAGAGVASAGITHAMEMKDAAALASAEMGDIKDSAGNLITDPAMRKSRIYEMLKGTGAASPSARLQAVGLEYKKGQAEDFFHAIQHVLPQTVSAGQMLPFDTTLSQEQNWMRLENFLSGLTPVEQEQMSSFIELYSNYQNVSPELMKIERAAGRLTDAQAKMVMDRQAGDKTSIVTWDEEGMTRFETEEQKIGNYKSIIQQRPDHDKSGASREQKDKYEKALAQIINITNIMKKSGLETDNSKPYSDLIGKLSGDTAMTNYTSVLNLITDYVWTLNLPIVGDVLEFEGFTLVRFNEHETPGQRMHRARMSLYNYLVGRLNQAGRGLEMTPNFGDLRGFDLND